ncbi:hypothetical protein GS462_04205 [Rhodococcus hoagii]|uniref:hypothetical protein n=1 Tax=Rhodococcus hoagii TaxID=43767 RepID=UPI0009BCCDE5|nr:hypothetical protein [Prescottella equi]MBM4523805.1 hypothetical protein [Prescottella equi]MBM4649612.1 hypothetical protein [Prescottella equi]MBM4682828.1 hypothetical protein [Prescottella equi]NKS79743.1 hypothetical protein [Prescottella equi]OQQ25890.1 hypothetical protein A6410_18620 [Prescottella equi]
MSVGLALCLFAVVLSSPQTLCADSLAAYVPGAYREARRIWPFPVALCTTGVVGESSDTAVAVAWGPVALMLLGVVLAWVSVLAFRREGAGRV